MPFFGDHVLLVVACQLGQCYRLPIWSCLNFPGVVADYLRFEPLHCCKVMGTYFRPHFFGYMLPLLALLVCSVDRVKDPVAECRRAWAGLPCPLGCFRDRFGCDHVHALTRHGLQGTIHLHFHGLPRLKIARAPNLGGKITSLDHLFFLPASVQAISECYPFVWSCQFIFDACRCLPMLALPCCATSRGSSCLRWFRTSMGGRRERGVQGAAVKPLGDKDMSTNTYQL